jgi:23S rRNA (adenine2503-C2)-methyltransferase
MQNNFFDLSRNELSEYLESIGEPKFRISQVWEAVYSHLWAGPSEFFNIPKSLRERLAHDLSFSSLTPTRTLESKDHLTRKVLFELADKNYIETVFMEYEKRRTLCISSQSGCPIGCVFCATGQMGFSRNLSSGEIIEQVLYFSRILKEKADHLTNVVIMGMGEPFLNYDNTLAAVDRLNDREGFDFGARRFTISTVGILPGIERFTREARQVNLAVSLHAPNNDLRSSLVPIIGKYPIKQLIETCRNYTKFSGRRISFEYALIDGINDSPDLARELTKLIKGILCHVNLIQLNKSAAYSHQPSSFLAAKSFLKILQDSGIPVTLRLRRGIEINAGCGQLAFSSDQPIHQS